MCTDIILCLALQLKELDRLDPAMQALLENLDLLAKRDVKALVEVCGVDAEDVTDMVAEIRELDPKPAEAFDDIVSQPVVPDVIMRPQPGGGWMVELNSATLPRVLVNNTYFARISKEAGSFAPATEMPCECGSPDCLKACARLLRNGVR